VDAATIDAAKRGDKAAQATLLTALQDVWFRFCLSQLRSDRDLAADATQETALRFLKQLASFRGESQLQTWSLSIALNVVREQRRKRQFDALDSAQEPVAVTRQVARLTELDEEKALLKQHLDALPERQREAITLRFFEELNVEETAAAMKCAEGTVKATVHQALRSLREKLKQLR
jgi:RNA polymerase sigma-70 factor (ECF subfamily)